MKGYPESQYRYGLELNVIGAFNTVQAFAPVLATNAHLYNISSGMAHIAPMWVEHWSYAAGKAAVVKMFDLLAKSSNPSGMWSSSSPALSVLNSTRDLAWLERINVGTRQS